VVTQVVVSAIALALLLLLGAGLWRWATQVARWDVVTDNLRLFGVGIYTRTVLWRPALALALVCALLGLSAPVMGSIVRSLVRFMGAALVVMLALPAAAPLVTRLMGEQLGGLARAFATAAPYFAAALAALVAGYGVGTWIVRRAGDNSRSLARPARALRIAWVASVPALLFLLRGFDGMTVVPLDKWGGLLLTLTLAVVAIALSFPLGVLLALGRRSSLPLVKVLSVTYIEIVRAVPLVTVLFMASVMLPLVLPADIRPSSVIRALAGLTLFSAAYVAEDVRGGLASVGRGQYEASTALGLGTLSTYRFIVLPQAIRTVIPAIVGQFISLFKDTSLVIILGLRELLGIAQAVVNQPEFLGLYREVLIFIAVIYFIFSTVMSRTSRQIERQLNVGDR
jgi:general L-amino acid transport system permease protein